MKRPKPPRVPRMVSASAQAEQVRRRLIAELPPGISLKGIEVQEVETLVSMHLDEERGAWVATMESGLEFFVGVAGEGATEGEAFAALRAEMSRITVRSREVVERMHIERRRAGKPFVPGERMNDEDRRRLWEEVKRKPEER